MSLSIAIVVLLIDRKPMLLTIEDVRYDMISEVDFHNRVMGATIRVFTPMRNMVFSSWSNVRLRKCLNYIQQRVMEIRSHGLNMQGQFNTGQPFYGVNPMPAHGQVAQGANTQPQNTGYTPVNPYTKVPMLSRRRRFPSFY